MVDKPQPAEGLPARRSIRLRGYDYSQAGTYFITLCRQNRECLFGAVERSKVTLSPSGWVVREELIRTTWVRRNVGLDQFVIMPNHLHAILILNEGIRATRRVAPTHAAARGPGKGSLGAVIGQFKSNSAKRINELRGTPGVAVWQRNYFEHVIRSERGLENIRKYIELNPAVWELDPENPKRRATSGDEIETILEDDSRHS